MKKTGLKKGNKITKLIAALLCAGMLLTGCGNSGSKKIEFKGDNTGNKTTEGGAFDSFGGGSQSEMTLSEYILANQPCIVYLNAGSDNSKNENDSKTPESYQQPAKDEEPEGFYYFHDNVVTMYDTDLTWGEISRMSDEEILSSSTIEEYATNAEYKFAVFTDETGNNFKGESIFVKEVYGSGESDVCVFDGHSVHHYFLGWMTASWGTACQVYDASYIGWTGYCPTTDSGMNIARPSWWIKEPADVTIVLDQPNSPNVVLDPECDGDGEVEDSIFE